MVFETSKKQISEEEFNVLLVHLKTIDQVRLDMAKDVLVHGLKPSEVAKKYEVSPQRISMNTSVVWKAYEYERELNEMRGLVTAAVHISSEKPKNNLVVPAGWEQVTLLAPSSLVNKFRLEVQESILGATK